MRSDRRADDEPETRVVALNVVVLVLAWAVGWFAIAGPPPSAPTQ